jgi:hypothetical protein
MTGSEVSRLHRSTKCFKRPAINNVSGESTVCNEYQLTVSLTLLCTGCVIEEFTAFLQLPLSFSLHCETDLGRKISRR